MKKVFTIYFAGLEEMTSPASRTAELERLNAKIAELLNDGYEVLISNRRYIVFVKNEMERHSDH